MSDADRTPAVGDRVWRQWKGTRYEGRVVGFDCDGDPVCEFGGRIGDLARNRLCLNETEWGFLDPAPASPEYVPMVGDVWQPLLLTVDSLSDSGQVYVRSSSGGAGYFNPDWLRTHATLVSRPEKPLAVGEKVTHGRYGGVSGEIIAIKADMAWVEYPLPVGDVVLFLADLRRAPEGT